MTEFFNALHTGQTTHNDCVLKHHFTFGEYYEPTKFGRSTLRRADYITLNHLYEMSAHRDYVLVLYPLSDTTLSLDDALFFLKANSIYGFIIPKATKIILSSEVTEAKIILCECDTNTLPSPTITPFDFEGTDTQNIIQSLTISQTHSVNCDNKPFFGLVLEGDFIINDKKIGFYDGFYTDNQIDIQGNGKILTFTMPIPL